MSMSEAQLFAGSPAIGALSSAEIAALEHCWRFWARPNQLPPEGDWTIWLLLAGRGFGKALALDTPIATPSGWSTMADLKVGDTVFDETGAPCSVTGTFDVEPESAYRFTFSDGSSIDCCGGHQWVTWEHRDRKALLRGGQGATKFPPNWPEWRSGGELGPKVRTATEVVQTLGHGKRGDRNHCIPVAGSLELPTAILPIEPYVLGAWLGDGSSAGGAITIGDDDAPEMLEELRACGTDSGRSGRKPYARSATYSIGTQPHRRDASSGRMLPNGSLHSKLSGLGLLKNKHVPSAYLRASKKQRLGLLQGLMDTDGSVSKTGHAEFTSTKRCLADAVEELARSLGQKPVLSEGRAKIDGRYCGPKWRVTFRPTIQVFRLSRKTARLSFVGAQSLRNHHRMLVSAKPIALQPMRCIQVDSKHSLFLAGKAMIPTHNTRTGAEYIRERVEAIGPEYRAGLIGSTAADVRDVMLTGESGLLNIWPESQRPKFEPSKRKVTFHNGAVAKLYSAEEPDRLRGPQHHDIWADELAAWNRLDDTWSNAMMGLRLGDRPRAVVTTTPRPLPMLKEWVRAAADGNPSYAVTRGRSYDNAGNMPTEFFDFITAQYGGTRLGQQELEGEILEPMGALFKDEWFRYIPEPPKLSRVVVSIDPAITTRNDETGIMVVGRAGDKGYVLEDLSGMWSPEEWARKAIAARDKWIARCGSTVIVAETNRGGDLVANTIKQIAPHVFVKEIRGYKGKDTRAEPIAALYEQKRIFHCGKMVKLEDQMVNWDPTGIDELRARHKARSPDRMDALVHGIHELGFHMAAVPRLADIDVKAPRRI